MLVRGRVARRTRRLDHRDAQPAGGPSDVKANLVAFAQHLDSGEIAAQGRSDDLDVRKLEADFASGLRTNSAPPTIAVEPHQNSLVEVAGKALAAAVHAVLAHERE